MPTRAVLAHGTNHHATATEDERSIANRLANEERKEKEGDEDTPEVAALKKDPTAPVRLLYFQSTMMAMFCPTH